MISYFLANTIYTIKQLLRCIKQLDAKEYIIACIALLLPYFEFKIYKIASNVIYSIEGLVIFYITEIIMRHPVLWYNTSI